MYVCSFYSPEEAKAYQAGKIYSVVKKITFWNMAYQSIINMLNNYRVMVYTRVAHAGFVCTHMSRAKLFKIHHRECLWTFFGW